MTEKQKRFEELANRSNERGYTVYSDFLGLSEISEFCAMRFPVPATLWGGYEDAERCVACFGDREYFTDNADYPIKCILILFSSKWQVVVPLAKAGNVGQRSDRKCVSSPKVDSTLLLL